MLSRRRILALTTIVVRPFRAAARALVTGAAGPPFPRSRRLRPRLPLLRLRPDLVFGADMLLAWILFATGLSYLEAESATVAPQCVPPPFTSHQWAVLVAAAQAVPVALRTRWPLASWRVLAVSFIASATWVTIVLGDPYTPAVILSYLLCAYSLGLRCDGETTAGAFAVTAIEIACFDPALFAEPPRLIITLMVVALPLLAGHLVGTRRRAARRLAEEQRRTAEERQARAVLAERARIARELHDVVAHHMSVIAIQAEAVPMRAKDDPDQLRAGLAEIREISLRALAEMRRVLGILRDPDGERVTAPMPGLTALHDLVATARGAGHEVTLRADTDLGDLPGAVSLSAYRIAQEALSNAMRHAPGSAITVGVSRGPMRGSREGAGAEELRLTVVNGPGTAAASPAAASGGQGLIGMRERAAMLGGTLRAGHDRAGGFAVTATLPITAGDDVPHHDPTGVDHHGADSNETGEAGEGR